MPIYAYRCSSCGHEKDVLQKVSDAPLTQCPACGAEAFTKQLTAAGFQLKGSGWYVTDFRNNGSKPAGKDGKESKDAGASADSGGKDGDSKAAASDSGKSQSAPAAGAD